MKGTKKQKKDTSSLNLFDNLETDCNDDSSLSPTSTKQSKIISFSTVSSRIKSSESSALEEKAIKSILERASKLKW